MADVFKCWLGKHLWSKWYTDLNAKWDIRYCLRCHKQVRRRM